MGGNPAHGNRKADLAAQTGYRPYGECGLVVGRPVQEHRHLCGRPAVVRLLWTNHNDHGRSSPGRRDGIRANWSIRTLVPGLRGLGLMNENLPEFQVPEPRRAIAAGTFTYGAAYLGPEHGGGVRLNTDPKNPLPFIRPPEGALTLRRDGEPWVSGRLNRLSGNDYPDDHNQGADLPPTNWRSKCRPACLRRFQLDCEPEHIRRMCHGLDQDGNATFGEQYAWWTPGRARGVRLCADLHGGGGGGAWMHSEIKSNHTSLASQVDLPVAGLFDLLTRPVEDTRWWCSGRSLAVSPGAEARDAIIIRRALRVAGGGGVRGACSTEARTRLVHAVDGRHFVADIHAAVLHQPDSAVRAA